MREWVRMLVLGAVGFGFAWVGWHLWIDHGLLHALINIRVAQEQAQQRATGTPPVPPPVPTVP